MPCARKGPSYSPHTLLTYSYAPQHTVSTHTFRSMLRRVLKKLDHFVLTLQLSARYTWPFGSRAEACNSQVSQECTVKQSAVARATDVVVEAPLLSLAGWPVPAMVQSQ